jgi:hypothetical protein
VATVEVRRGESRPVADSRNLFAQRYREALAMGVDPIEEADAAHELPCGCLPCRPHGTMCDDGLGPAEVAERVRELVAPEPLPRVKQPEDWRERARRLRDEGMKYDEIAQLVGQPMTDVYRAVKAAKNRRGGKAA